MNTTSLTKMQRELVAATERAESAEAELLAVREDNHSMMLEIDGLRTERDRLAAELQKLREHEPAVPAPSVPDGDDFNGTTPHLILCMEALVRLDADGILVPHGIGRDASKLLSAAANRLRKQTAPSVPEEWREVMVGLVAIAEKKGKKHGSPNHCHKRPGIWDDDNGPVLSGKPCAECAMYDRARALLQSATPPASTKMVA